MKVGASRGHKTAIAGRPDRRGRRPRPARSGQPIQGAAPRPGDCSSSYFRAARSAGSQGSAVGAVENQGITGINVEEHNTRLAPPVSRVFTSPASTAASSCSSIATSTRGRSRRVRWSPLSRRASRSWLLPPAGRRPSMRCSVPRRPSSPGVRCRGRNDGERPPAGSSCRRFRFLRGCWSAAGGTLELYLVLTCLQLAGAFAHSVELYTRE